MADRDHRAVDGASNDPSDLLFGGHGRESTYPAAGHTPADAAVPPTAGTHPGAPPTADVTGPEEPAAEPPSPPAGPASSPSGPASPASQPPAPASEPSGPAAQPRGPAEHAEAERLHADPSSPTPTPTTPAGEADAAAAAPSDQRRPRRSDGPPPGDDADNPPFASEVPRRRRSDDTEDGKGGGAGSFFRELPVLLLIAFVLAFLLRTFVLQVFYIPSTSMAPTLQIDDRMVVEKLTYLAREPRRGEVVVFEGEAFDDPTLDTGTPARIVRGVGQFLGVVPANARDFVKRVIGLPGDEVVIEDGQVFVNGEALDEPYVVYPDLSDYGPVTVPEGHLFFLGDNRPNSSDSRRSLGMVPEDHVVGRAMVIIWPMSHADRLTGVEHDVPDVASGTE
ncbi:signal peptidase I [Egicoccus sp. AB-alg2]|uniref:signal peptidase I n=1 Tax=Egicoccus sp. AB-alg2 TaxID=3242693 RepID=UPI00359CE3BA